MSHKNEPSDETQVAGAISEFTKLCPEYVDTPNNSQIIGSYFPEDFGRLPSAKELELAYRLAVLEGKFGRSIN